MKRTPTRKTCRACWRAITEGKLSFREAVQLQATCLVSYTCAAKCWPKAFSKAFGNKGEN